MSAEGSNIYNKLPDDHETVTAYQPVFLDRGGEHLVYEVPEHPDSVIKASTFVIQDVLSDNTERGLALNDLSGDMRAALEEKVAAKTAQILQFRQYFGREHMLPERRYLIRVPISEEIVREIFKNDWKNRPIPEDVETIREVWTVAVVQQKSAEISDPNHLGAYFGGFVEERPDKPDPQAYQHVDTVFSDGKEITQKDLELFFTVQDNPKSHALADLVQRCEKDENLKTEVQDFVRTAIQFARDTGNILALAGKDNVIFYPKDGGWNYLLVDAVPIADEPILTRAKEIKDSASSGAALTKEEEGYPIRAKNFVRTMNGMAAALGMEERLSF